jgi:phosphate starvation-inducible PhoH-like protein
LPLPKNNLLFGFAPKLTDEQKVYVDSIFDNQLTIVNAKSGSGKTTLAVACAKIIGKPLVYVFSPVEEKKMGFRPGNQAEKEAEYLTPLKDALMEISEIPEKAVYNSENIEAMKAGHVWVYPMSHTFARGINLKDKTIIIAESQNYTKGDLKKILTRIHDSCTVILEGHTGHGRRRPNDRILHRNIFRSSQSQPSSPQGLTIRVIKTQGGANYGKVRIYRNLGGNQRAIILRIGRRITCDNHSNMSLRFITKSSTI